MIEAIVGAVALIIVALIGKWDSKKTRAMNTEEHARAGEERKQAQDSILLGLEIVHSEVVGMRDDLREHREDPHAHERRSKLRVVDGG